MTGMIWIILVVVFLGFFSIRYLSKKVNVATMTKEKENAGSFAFFFFYSLLFTAAYKLKWAQKYPLKTTKALNTKVAG